MKNSSILLSFFLILFLIFSSCQKQSPVAPDLNRENDTAAMEKAEQIALEMIKLSNWEIDPAMKTSTGSEISLEKVTCGPDIKFIDRLHVAADIYHYVWVMKMGPHPWDRVGIHRVIKERSERHRCRPIRTDKNIFLQHGDCKDFEGMFLPGTRSPNMPNDFGFAVYLAENEVDVWGIDQAWALVPDVGDRSFMMGWGMQKHVNDLRTAMQAAFFVRMLTGCGDNKLNLLGYSSGVWTGYALLNQESQYPVHHRVAGGFVAADGAYKTDNEALRQSFFVTEYNRTKAMLDQGEYGDFVPFAMIAKLARTDPDGDSPLFPGFTNMQAAMFFAAGPILGEFPFHYFGGVWENDFPVDFQYVTKDEYFDFMEAAVPWEAAQFINDYCAIANELVDTPFDDHLGDITVPILNLSPAGGFGEASKYTTTFLGSTDITHLMPSLHPPDEILLDFGHIDIFLAKNAKSLVWRPVLDWVNTH